MWWPGEQRPPMVSFDCCPDGDGEGFAWVRYVREQELLTPTAQRGFGGGQVCQTVGRVQLTVEAGVYRCLSEPDATDNGANCDALSAQARERELDKATLHAATVCCSATEGHRVTLFGSAMIGPAAGGAGSAVTVNIGLR